LNLVGSLLGLLLQNQLVTITQNLVGTTTNLNTVIQQVNQLQLADVAGTVPDIAGQLLSVTNTLTSLQGQLQGLTANLNSLDLQNQVGNLAGQIGTLTGNLNSLTSVISAVPALLSGLISTTADLVSQVLDLVGQLVTELLSDLTRLVDLNAVLSQLTGQVSGVLNQAQLEGVTNNLSQLTDLITGLRNVQTQMNQISGILSTLDPTQQAAYADAIATYNAQKSLLDSLINQLSAV